MKNAMILFSLLAATTVMAAPSIYVENTNEYSAYYTQQQAGQTMRSFNGCTSQTIGSIVFEDCSMKVKVPDATGTGFLPPENDKDMRCHFEYQTYNPDFYKILVSSCL
jgi:hypothetical protein